MNMRRLIDLVEGKLSETYSPDDLRHFVHEPNFNVRSQRDWKRDEFGADDDSEDEGPALFPDGGQWFICTDWACYVRRALGDRAKIYGFYVEDNPTATDMPVEGHDFAVVDDRYIVDGWAANVEGLHDGVIDMSDPTNAEMIRRYYGDPKLWKRGVDIERTIDNEPPQAREKALRGVKPFGK